MPNVNSNNYTINKKHNAATVVIVVNIVSRSIFVFNHRIRMFNGFDDLTFKLTKLNDIDNALNLRK